ncbi:OTU domain-containing protein 6A-like [Mesoplodon densirostris]|uniref:OTU domain-containing protein 6A-like n=1 Tax=Mesoplodon densirostris TaxID=48708 RepID=UPI0028DCE549|nr:OTU domain-containing protein 6A-like [Mesoplodon densirostris]XP_059942484.1 OTU domain-containing protein 6A-like [Mesoplodon densirostris]
MEDSQSEHQRMLRRHKREKAELQAHIQGMKSSVPKSDKKRRKQLLLDVARLEAEMEQKHQQELQKFQESFPDNSNLDSVTEDLGKLDLEDKPPHLSRAQRRRERKVALERERQERMAKAEMEHLASFRHDEEMKLDAILWARNLEMKDIPADGHCMYRAIQDQLVFSVTVEGLRRCTAEYMRKHVEDFLPFCSDPETGDACSRDDFLSYCDDIVFSASCGGQLELRALSHVLQTPIEVIQGNSPAVVFGEEYTKKPLTLVYRSYSMCGEHYNSVKPLDTGSVRCPACRLL